MSLTPSVPLTMGLAPTSPPGDPRIAAVERLSAKLTKDNLELDKADRYYSGDQPLAFFAPEVAAQVGGRLTPLVINWPEVIVDSVARRLRVVGFALGKGGEADAEMWRVWQANDMDEESSLGHVDALVHARAFLAVWGNDEDPKTPLIAVESAHQMAVEYEPGGRRIRAALKRWSDGEWTYATLYGPNQVFRYRQWGGTLVYTGSPRWEPVPDQPVLDNPLGVVPVVPLVNKGRLLARDGRSELKAVMPIADAINKLATDMMVSSEFHASPRRWATGIAIPSDPSNRDRLQAEVKAYWDEATKGKTWLAGTGVNFGQFPEASLTGYVEGIELLTRALAAIGGLPAADLGMNTTNPASAEARRAEETTLILRAQEKKDVWSGSYERVNRLVKAIQEGVPLAKVPEEYRSVETLWDDSATPAVSQTFDAAAKGVESAIFDLEQARAFVGLSPAQRQAIAERARSSAAEAATADIEARMVLARRLRDEDGLTLNAAMAAAGLIAAAATNSAETPSSGATPGVR